MLTKVRIKNFKCYGSEGALFDLSRINFIYGDNSVGKSTFLQFLELLLQEKYDKLSLERHLFKGLKKDESGNDIHVSAKFRFKKGDGVVDCEFAHSDENQAYEFKALNGTKINEAFWDSVLPKGDGQTRIHRCAAPRQAESKKPADSQKEGSKKISSLMAIETQAHLSLNQNSAVYVNDLLKRLDIPYQCVVDENGKILSDKIRDKYFDIEVDIKDVGTGIEGLFRLAIQLSEWKGGILAIEEPETNVNENQLAALTKVLVEETLKRPEGQLIVECHSELVIKQLQGLLRKGLLMPDELSVLVVSKKLSGSIVRKIKFDKNGNILTPWPGGYFPALSEILNDTFSEDKQ